MNYEEANKELRALLEESVAKCRERMKEEKGTKMLDGEDPCADIHEETERKYREICKKYGIELKW